MPSHTPLGHVLGFAAILAALELGCSLRPLDHLHGGELDGGASGAGGAAGAGATGGSSGGGGAGDGGAGDGGGSSGGAAGSEDGGSDASVDAPSETGSGGGASGSGGGAGEAGGSGSGGSEDAGMDPPDAACVPCELRAALVHRYRFEGTGSDAVDSVGSADGVIVNATLEDTGGVILAGGSSGEYVDLPNGIASALTSATFEAWVTWDGGAAWQRIFDFGDVTSGEEGEQGSGRSYLMLTPLTSGTGGVLRVAYKKPDTPETLVNSTAPLPMGELVHVAVVVDDAANVLSLFQDGALIGLAAPVDSLSLINDVNNWLGRSQYSSDPEFAGTIHEFRVYAAALTGDQIAQSFAEGPDPDFLED